MRNRLAWGLIWVLIVVLVLVPVGYAAMFVHGAERYAVRLLKTREWAFGRGDWNNNDHGAPMGGQWTDCGFFTVYTFDRIRR